MSRSHECERCTQECVRHKPKSSGASCQADRHGYDYQHAAEEDPGGVAADVAGLHQAKDAAYAAGGESDAVNGAIDHARVGGLPEDGARTFYERVDYGGIVDFIYVPFVVDGCV